MLERRKFMIRQQGQRNLGLDSIGGDGDADALPQHHSSYLEKSHRIPSFTRAARSLNRLSHIAEYGYPWNDNDCISISSSSTGLPSLASINPASVVDGNTSLYSSYQDSANGLSRYGSVVSASSSYYDPDDTVSVASSIVSELTLRSKMMILLRQGIEESLAAATLECLEPVIDVKRTAEAQHATELAKWSSRPTPQQSCCRNEFTVCRSFVEDEELKEEELKDDVCSTRSPVSVYRDENRQMPPSRNTSAAPSQPASRNLRRMMSDSIPVMPMPYGMMRDTLPEVPPRRRSTEDKIAQRSYLHPKSTSIKALDQVPAPPKRRDSFGRAIIQI